jgi:phosphatidylglycerol:prolipoprotein diacylglycerol transferase
MHPVICQVGAFSIYTYGLLIAIGFLAAVILASAKCRKTTFAKQVVIDLSICLLIYGIIGARLLHVIVNWQYYSNNLTEIVMLQHGGLAFQGGLFLAIAGGWLYLKKRKIDFFEIADLIMPYVALGQSLGRIGCFFNGCCYGRETLSFLGVKFPQIPVLVYPTQLFYSFSWLAVFIILNIIYDKRGFSGQVFSLYIIFYGAIRFLIDFLRGDLTYIWGGLTLTQIISLLFVFIGIVTYLMLVKNAGKKVYSR